MSGGTVAEITMASPRNRPSDKLLAVMYETFANLVEYCPICRSGFDVGLQCDYCGANFMPIVDALGELIEHRKELNRG
jgi:hypothetical protein